MIYLFADLSEYTHRSCLVNCLPQSYPVCLKVLALKCRLPLDLKNLDRQNWVWNQHYEEFQWENRFVSVHQWFQLHPLLPDQTVEDEVVRGPEQEVLLHAVVRLVVMGFYIACFLGRSDRRVFFGLQLQLVFVFV